jgi:diguanylate cyclase (GGDEF)-like protein
VNGTSASERESQYRNLREANGRLIVATLKAQQLEMEAEAANQQRLNFLAIVAHELRNPIAPIRHAIKLLGNDALGEPEKRWSCGVITRQVEHMARLLDDLLDTARITLGQLVLKPSAVDLRSIVTDAVDVARPLMENKRHSLEIHLPDEPITLMVDGVRIAQVLSNLLTNAAKYSDPGGRIAVSVQLDSARFAISVRDSGIGIPAENLPNLFKMFSQLQSTLDRAEGGLGIGLAFAGELVKMHGGRIDVLSDGKGTGSEFIVILPLSVVQKESKPARSERTAMTRTNRSLRILIADDNVDAATSLGMLLEMAGNNVLVVHDGTDAVIAAQQYRPQVAILDIGMPRLNGYQVAEKLRGEILGPDVLLIALTGWGQADDKARAVAAGFDHHFTKPVNSDELEALISQHAATPRADEANRDERAPAPAPSLFGRISDSPNSRPRRSEQPMKPRGDSAILAADLAEANEELVLAALHAETIAATALENLNELTWSSQRDVLTDTLNRPVMLDRITSAIAMAKRHNTHVAVLFVDLDNFKKINDGLGHAVGDDVLQRTARRLKSTVRASDAVSRHGGDEFLVLLTEISRRADAGAIASEILKALIEPPPGGVPMSLPTASIGISVFPEDGTDATSLISRADAAMYQAKQNGRNRCEFYGAEAGLLERQRAQLGIG